MGGKTTDTQGLFGMGRDIHDWYAQQAGLFQNKADEFYRNAQPHLEKAMGINDGLMGLTNDQAVLGRQIFGSMPLYMEQQGNLANQQMGLAQRQGGFMDAQQAAMAQAMGYADKSLGYADQAMGQADASRQQAQTAYGDSRALMNEYNSVYRPANAKLINDAMNFNTAAHREGLAQQAAADAGRAFSTTMKANAQQQLSVGVNPNSRRFQAQQNQNALALAAGRANAMTSTRRQAEQEGVARLTNAANSKGGAHLLDASGNMFNAGTNAMNSATGAMNAGAGFVNAGTSALGTGIQAGNSLLDAGNQAASNAYSAYNSLMSGALNAGEFGNQSAQLTSGLANNNLGLVNGLDQQYLGNWLQGLNINTQGLNALMGMYGQGYGLEAQNNANQNAFTNGLIGAVGAAMMFSDRRLKRDIERVGTYDNGLPMYEFAYRDAPERRYRGVMADDVLKIRPEAVIVAADGYQRVNYPLLGITLEAVA